MKEIEGDIWTFHEQGYWIVITTNGIVKGNGEAVMGKGIALQAKRRFPRLPSDLGMCLKMWGNMVFIMDSYNILTFPTKHDWREKADLNLIEESCKHLASVVPYTTSTVYMVRPGCANGQLDWKDVKPILEKYLDDRFIVVDRREI